MMSVISAVVLLGSGDPSAAASGFRSLGFEAQIVSPRGLVILGEATLFEERFRVELRRNETGIWVLDESRAPRRALPETALPVSLQAQVQAIEFEAPLDFGPDNP